MKTIFMPKKKWQKWDRALRKGGYIQGRFSLYVESEQSFCCLGVLQHCLANGEIEYNYEHGDYLKSPSREWLSENDIIFLDQSGDSDVAPFLPKIKASAIYANDVLETSFIKIADAIKDAVEFTDAKK